MPLKTHTPSRADSSSLKRKILLLLRLEVEGKRLVTRVGHELQDLTFWTDAAAHRLYAARISTARVFRPENESVPAWLQIMCGPSPPSAGIRRRFTGEGCARSQASIELAHISDERID
jgi:hypothetical protein